MTTTHRSAAPQSAAVPTRLCRLSRRVAARAGGAVTWLGLCFAVTVNASAVAHIGFEPLRQLCVPDCDGTPAQYSRAVYADLTGDGVLDAVLLDGSTAVFLYGPERYQYAFPLAEDVTSIAVVGGIGPTRRSDLFTNGADGVVRWKWDQETGQFSPWSQPGSWSPSMMLVGNERGPDLACFEPGQDRVDLYEVDDAGLILGSTISFPSAVEQVALADLDAAGRAEVAVTTATGLSIVDGMGSLIQAVQRPAGTSVDRDVLGVLSAPVLNGDALAWIAASSGSAELCVVSSAGVVEQLALGPIRATSLAGAPAALDRHPDICIALEDAGSALVLVNDAAADPDGFSFSLDPDFAIPLGLSSGGDSKGTIGYRDFDNDGDADALLPNAPLGQCWYFEGSTMTAESFRMGLDGEASLLNTFGPFGFFAYLHVSAPPADLADATGFELLAWREADVDSPPEWSATAYAQWLFTGEPSWPETLTIFFVEQQSYRARYVELRPFRDVPGEARVAYPGRFVGLFNVEAFGEYELTWGEKAVAKAKEGGVILDMPPPRFPLPIPDID